MVEGIERLKAEFDLSYVSKRKLFEQAEIDVLAARPMVHARPAAAEGAWRWRRKSVWIDEDAALCCNACAIGRCSAEGIAHTVRVRSVVAAGLTAVCRRNIERITRLQRDDSVDLPIPQEP